MTAAVVLDVEGTTSATSHVYTELFPYARSRMAEWVSRHGHEPQTRAILDEVGRRCGRSAQWDDRAAVRTLMAWSDEDAKIAPLKSLQGLIWRQGYASGELSGHIYADTLLALRSWLDRGTSVYLYSSGSVQAQRDLFAHTQFGDLRDRLSGYFDTTSAGGKHCPDSYRIIARRVGAVEGQVLFASDCVKELDSARSAGLRTAWVKRPEETSRAASAQGTHPHALYRNLIAVAEAQPG
ncbi:acireductone synthase [Streptomyces sp. NPDC017056]|uniref:acireductone synthase n=1 Tax=Streptomyces sp. NPDC017056 TaxID=3364973 RepID=UPI0037AEE3D2